MTKTTATKRKTATKPRTRIDVEVVRDAAAGRWLEILSAVAGIGRDDLDGQHHPCPRCGGSDRFRLVDEDAGAVLCNQCFSSRNGDGFAAVAWMRGVKFPEAARLVADYVGVDAGGSGSPSAKPHPSGQLVFKPWSDVIAALWCRHKPGVTVAGVKAAGGKLARYIGQYTVLAFPAWGRELDKLDPVGWVLVNTTGGPLPRSAADGQVEWIHKPKLTYGSSPGLLGDLERLRSAAAVWKLEGVSDLLAWLSMADLPQDHAAITNAMGCQERPAKWMCEAIGGGGKNTVHVLHDADVPGQRGAVGWDDHGRHRAGWAEELAGHAVECRNVVLPFPVSETHGKDFRDWVLECGGDFTALRALSDQAEIVRPHTDQANEAMDDPHRLARLNLERYAARNGGRTLRFWAGGWWVWKQNRYVSMLDAELHAKVTAAVKEEFDRVNLEQLEEFRARKEGGELEDGEKMPVAKKVTPAIVNSVLSATRGLTYLSGEMALDSWIPERKRRNYLSMRNGLLNIDALLAGGELSDVLLPHSPEWFSCVHLPYEFDPEATCPKWEAFLEKNLELDPERIKLLQEWTGYLVTPDTGEQRFMVFEGEGANGKSVACAAVEATIGPDNCSHVQFEMFGDRFSKTMTLGKLVNICGDAGELDQVAEGTLKAFTAGNTMMFDRKGLPGLTCTPTARLMIACNNLPRWKDRTDGVWRRVLLVPWQITIGPRERVKNMDKPWWWLASGECPGILNWALVGLNRLRKQGCFSDCEAMNRALEDYKCEVNPAKRFLLDHMAGSLSGHPLKAAYVYRRYREWCAAGGYMPLSERSFGRELFRAFKPTAKKIRRGERDGRMYCYTGVDFQEGILSAEEYSDAHIFNF